jgi:hypothetical protein
MLREELQRFLVAFVVVLVVCSSRSTSSSSCCCCCCCCCFENKCSSYDAHTFVQRYLNLPIRQDINEGGIRPHNLPTSSVQSRYQQTHRTYPPGHKHTCLTVLKLPQPSIQSRVTSFSEFSHIGQLFGMYVLSAVLNYRCFPNFGLLLYHGKS